jgi:hypothetical protein
MSALFLPVAFSLLAFSLTAPEPTIVQVDPDPCVAEVLATGTSPANAQNDHIDP